MSPWIEAAFAKYGWIWVGLTFGFAAKYALQLKRGVPVKARMVLADLLLLPMVALVAYAAAQRMGTTGELAALFSAFCAVGADRLVKLLTERFLRQIEAVTLRDLNSEMIESRGELRQTVQTVHSAQSLAALARGETPPDGTDTLGRLAHKFPPKAP